MKIIGVGWNYPKHNDELQAARPEHPVIFSKPDSALLRDNRPFYIPDFTRRVDYETELEVRINRLGRGIARKFAPRYYAEVGLGIDFTARDLQERLRSEGGPWELCKAFDNSAVISGFVPLAELGRDIQDLHFHLMLNGQRVQEGYTGDMLFSVNEIIAFASEYFTLRMGDLFYTGTPDGVGPVQPGDRLEGWLEDRLMFNFQVK